MPPYTSWGWMPQDEVDEILKDMDRGTITVYLEDPPDWFKPAGQCPVCNDEVAAHYGLQIDRPSGEIIACDFEGDGWTARPDSGEPIYY